MSESAPKPGVLSRLWQALTRPTAKYSLLTLAGGGFVAGVVFWGGFNTVMEATNTMAFCTSCHEMKDNVYKEYDKTIHHSNRTGVQATCSDCHVPKEWTHKMVRKIQASNEVFHWLLGSVNTPEKFDAKRLTLAKNVWDSMKRTDSRECRNCHTLESMNPEFQKPRARQQHLGAMETGGTCIDCHKGIAHKSVRALLTDAELETLEKPNPAYVREIPQTYKDGLARANQREKDADAKRQAEIDDKVKAAVAVAEARAAAAAAARAAADNPRATSDPARPTPNTPATGQLAAAAGGASAGAGGKIDWAAVAPKTLGFFYPGQASYEWVQTGKDHGGARAFLRGGDRCVTCHDKEVRDMGAKIVSGSKAEDSPIAGKRGSVDVTVQAARDAEKIYFRFQFPKAPHTPVSFAEGGKMDARNETKLTVMISGAGVEKADAAGCWVTCHHDARNMPDAPKPEALKAFPGAADIDVAHGVTKYLAESRTAVELKDSPRGGWDKLKPKEDIARMIAEGKVMEVLRFRSAEAPEHGLVVAERKMTALPPIEATGSLEGDTWTVVMSRALKASAPGEVTFEAGKKYVVSFALHEDFTASRFHHVSLAYELALDGDAEIVAKAQ